MLARCLRVTPLCPDAPGRDLGGLCLAQADGEEGVGPLQVFFVVLNQNFGQAAALGVRVLCHTSRDVAVLGTGLG